MRVALSMVGMVGVAAACGLWHVTFRLPAAAAEAERPTAEWLLRPAGQAIGDRKAEDRPSLRVAVMANTGGIGCTPWLFRRN